MPRTLPVSYVDVFTDRAFLGKALAVIHDADDLTDDQLAAIARWTNLSETTFLLHPTDPAADYRVRIFTTTGELPFAGHPTLGSAHAWLEAGGVSHDPDRVIQQCAAGLVTVRRGERLAFAAPPLSRSGPVDPDLRERVIRVNRLDPEEVVDLAWIDNGPGWIGVELRSAEAVLAAQPDRAAYGDLKVTLLGPYAADAVERLGKTVEVRAFYADGGEFEEDPVTGSANAGLAQWLIAAGRLPERYVAGQGQNRHRDGRVHVERVDGEIWVGGDVLSVVTGQILV